jgi:hypothetical protein
MNTSTTEFKLETAFMCSALKDFGKARSAEVSQQQQGKAAPAKMEELVEQEHHEAEKKKSMSNSNVESDKKKMGKSPSIEKDELNEVAARLKSKNRELKELKQSKERDEAQIRAYEGRIEELYQVILESLRERDAAKVAPRTKKDTSTSASFLAHPARTQNDGRARLVELESRVNSYSQALVLVRKTKNKYLDQIGSLSQELDQFRSKLVGYEAKEKASLNLIHALLESKDKDIEELEESKNHDEAQIRALEGRIEELENLRDQVDGRVRCVEVLESCENDLKQALGIVRRTKNDYLAQIGRMSLELKEVRSKVAKHEEEEAATVLLSLKQSAEDEAKHEAAAEGLLSLNPRAESEEATHEAAEALLSLRRQEAG